MRTQRKNASWGSSRVGFEEDMTSSNDAREIGLEQQLSFMRNLPDITANIRGIAERVAREKIGRTP